ncbi:MAG: surface-anchored protein [Lentimonas sp.]|jgi:surface-anchored protein
MHKKYTTLLSLSALSLLTAQANGQINFSSGHIDIGIAYEGGEWEPHVHDEENDIEYESDALLFHGDEANSTNFRLTAPGAGSFGFLGNAGDDIFIFPQVEDTSLPFIGIAAEEIDPADFATNEITLELSGFSGPGDFFLYQTDGFGTPNLLYDTTDGLNDVLTLNIGSHAHYNFAFSAEGVYNVTLTASGILNDGFNTLSTSAPATFLFGVNAVPEPSAFALIAGCMTLGFVAMRRRRS